MKQFPKLFCFNIDCPFAAITIYIWLFDHDVIWLWITKREPEIHIGFTLKALLRILIFSYETNKKEALIIINCWETKDSPSVKGIITGKKVSLLEERVTPLVNYISKAQLHVIIIEGGFSSSWITRMNRPLSSSSLHAWIRGQRPSIYWMIWLASIMRNSILCAIGTVM